MKPTLAAIVVLCAYAWLAYVCCTHYGAAQGMAVVSAIFLLSGRRDVL